MYFSGDPTARKRVDLGGKSSKERDRNKLLEQTRLERNKRQTLRIQNSAVTKIQKCYRGRKDVQLARLNVRNQFYVTYGDHCQRVDRNCFGPDSDFLRELLFFVNVKNYNDITLLLETCNLLLNYVSQFGNIINLFGGVDYSSNRAIVDLRVEKLVNLCLQAVFQNRERWKNQLFMPSKLSTMPAIILLETVICLVNPDLPWSCKVFSYIYQNKAYSLLRGIILTHLKEVKSEISRERNSSLEQVIVLISTHTGQSPCNCTVTDPKLSFYSQILTIPFLWHHLPHLKEALISKGLARQYINQMARYLTSQTDILPDDLGPTYPGFACLLSNLLEASHSVSTFDTVRDIVLLLTFLLNALPTIGSSSHEKPVDEDEPMDEEVKEETLSVDLERDISSALDSRLLQHLLNALFRGIKLSNPDGPPFDEESDIVGYACAFLHVTFSTLPLERVMTGLAYRTDIVRTLWEFVRKCHRSQVWPDFSRFGLAADSPGWILPLAVFCPIYKHMLMIIDNEEFYEQEKPLSLKDIRSLILILKQALWNLMWTMPAQKVSACSSDSKKFSLQNIKIKAKCAISDLLAQLQDWNNRRSFTPSSDFHSQEAMNENFVSQAMLENTRASEILKSAPFLVPFTTRVKVLTSFLTGARQRNGDHPALISHRLKIRRNRILEDAFSQLSSLSEDDLRGPVRVTFVNELGVEEAGIDGGGLFKDFMENISRAAFDIQYGLFKETEDHHLYPNPGSGLSHEQHLEYFRFLGCLVGKAMYEGILLDIPLATFFLSKLKQKYNYLNDLPSLDPELYRHLQFLKHFEGDVAELELYFVIVSNEYGEQREEELLPGGTNLRVMNENVITFIHLVANHRLNYQIRHQSLHFLRGFQQLIQKDWIDMFNEHEIQLLISGSLERMDVDDLRSNTTYTGNYHADHDVIQMFWEILKSFSLEHQKKFLKFVTGCSRGPLLGFKYLEPKFCIQRVGPFNDDEYLNRLPTAATCMNLLKLPAYRNKEQMRTKLMYAINAEAGFDLS